MCVSAVSTKQVQGKARKILRELIRNSEADRAAFAVEVIEGLAARGKHDEIARLDPELTVCGGSEGRQAGACDPHTAGSTAQLRRGTTR